MEIVINCRDIGFDCEGVIKGRTEHEVMHLAVEHAKSTHGLEDLTQEIVDRIIAVLRQQPSKA